MNSTLLKQCVAEFVGTFTLIFIGIGAMTDLQPLMENPKIILLGAAGQFGIFLTLLLALALGFDKLESVAIGIIGACDGPTAIYVSSKFAPHLLGAVSVAAEIRLTSCGSSATSVSGK